MWLDSRSSGKGDKEEPADVLGWEGTKVTSMMPITEREDRERLGPPTPTPDTWKRFRWQLDVCASLRRRGRSWAWSISRTDTWCRCLLGTLM